MMTVQDKQVLQPKLDEAAIAWAAKRIAEADGLIIAAGAGMGVDSGLPDFRGNAGFWKAYPALARDGTAFMDIASPATFRAAPQRAWGFYGHRLSLYRDADPHDGYTVLRKWGEAREHGYCVFTSNVDGQFQKAGYPASRVTECHGSIHELQCLKPCSHSVWSAFGLAPHIDATSCQLLSAIPTCPHCSGTARPNILLFNDSAWIGARYEKLSLLRQAWVERLRRPAVIEIGAGISLPTVRRFSQRMVLHHRASLIRINPHAPQVGSLPGVGIAAGAHLALAAIDAALGSIAIRG